MTTTRCPTSRGSPTHLKSVPARSPHPRNPTTPGDLPTHAQDVGLCTRYATINSAIPKPYDNAMDILPAASALQAALEDYPGASEPIRQAMSDVVAAYYARIAVFGGVPRQGLAEPPPDDRQSAQAAYDKAWEICGFDEG